MRWNSGIEWGDDHILKLISCYIENFGGLSKYSIQFQPGITVIEEPNGFGKTTLAEFIRAMFYGFPRASKTLEKNSRKKYLPWQGGKYGGNLVFEHEGKQYRIDRTFGEVPRQDTFILTDAKTRRRSMDFSENIGLELFQLDSDSFERSTYMPQIHDHASLTTDSIQAKLGDLVEDTNDINNFEKAITALRAKRSFYIPFRGNGGAVSEAQEHISQLQTELSEADGLYAEIEQLQSEVAQRSTVKKQKQGALESVRSDIQQASQATAKEALTKQYESLKNRQAFNIDELDEMNRTYVAGMPTKAELDELGPLYDQVLALDSQIIHTDAERDAEALIAANAQRFSSGVPTDQELREQQEKCRVLVSTESKLKNTGLSEEEERQYVELERFFQAGVPDESFLDQCQKERDELGQLCGRRDELQTSVEEETQIENLEIYFAAGLPSEEVLQQNQDTLKRINTLREKNVRLTAAQVQAAQAASSGKKKRNPMALLALILGAAALLMGGVMLTQQTYATGGICLGIGVVALIAAAYINLRRVVVEEIASNKQSAPALSDSDRAQIQSNEREAAAAEASVLEFVSQYITDARSLADKLLEIQTKRSSYVALMCKRDEMRERANALEEQIKELESQLEDRLRPYCKEGAVFDKNILLLQLRTQKAQFENIKQKKVRAQATVLELQETIQRLQQEISAFLFPFCGKVSPDAFDEQIADLQRVRDAYQSAEKLLAEKENRIAQRNETLKKCEDTVKVFWEKYQIRLDLRDRASFQDLCDNVKDYAELVIQIQKDREEVESFYQEHQEILQSPIPAEIKDLDGLKRAEQNLSGEITVLSNEILNLKQRVRVLQTKADQLPEKRDELEFWKQKKAEGIQNSAMLDRTIQFLQEAKEALSNNYLGTIKQSFAEYMHRITGEEKESLIVTPALDVQIVRCGQAREAAYFSTGQSDIITLCMRLALVDALFKETKPFVILDDPFVNLDDTYTERALKLLENIGTDHQVIYLVCNCSRRISGR